MSGNGAMKKTLDLLAKAESKAKARAPRLQATKPASKQLSLPLWPDAVRAIPNAVLRGALFNVAKARENCTSLTLIASVSGVEIRFKGERLNQTDLDVWEQLLHLARLQPVGSQIRFNTKTFLRTLDRQTGKTQRDQLHEEIIRLRSGTVDLLWTEDRKRFFGGLISKGFKDEETQEYIIELEPRILELYQNGYSHIDHDQRQMLGSNNIARWLHAFYSTHEHPYPYKVTTLRDLCGSTIGQLSVFRSKLKEALALLVNVGAIVSWHIDQNDLVVIHKTVAHSTTSKGHLGNTRGASR